MSSNGSITRYLRLLQEGDRAAAPPLWEAYLARLMPLARARLRNLRSRAIAVEDVAISRRQPGDSPRAGGLPAATCGRLPGAVHPPRSRVDLGAGVPGPARPVLRRAVRTCPRLASQEPESRRSV
jgi:hypothetical protein